MPAGGHGIEFGSKNIGHVHLSVRRMLAYANANPEDRRSRWKIR